jgi:DNA-binding GntR family transcriptional regulator
MQPYEPVRGSVAVSMQRVYQGVMKDLEEGRMVPGQRLVETELAARYQVGRNAVREAMQKLAARGVVDLSRHRSPGIRYLDPDETLEVLDVASALTGLAARTAALKFDAQRHASRLQAAMEALDRAQRVDEPGMFSHARRHFYRALLTIGGNRELQRLFPAIGMHIIYAQYQTRQLRGIRIADYRAIAEAVVRRDPAGAAKAGHSHVDHVRKVITDTLEKDRSAAAFA